MGSLFCLILDFSFFLFFCSCSHFFLLVRHAMLQYLGFLETRSLVSEVSLFLSPLLFLNSSKLFLIPH